MTFVARRCPRKVAHVQADFVRAWSMVGKEVASGCHDETAKSVRVMAQKRADRSAEIGELVGTVASCANADCVLNTRDAGGKAAVHYAAWRGSIETLDAVLALASDPVALVNLISTGPCVALTAPALPLCCSAG
jgi:hypothetical protein